MNLEQLRILIVGAGIAGLALGRALLQRGCCPDIIERNTDWSDAGTGMYLPGNALRALRTLELDVEVEKRGARIETQRFCDDRGRLLSEVNLAPCGARSDRALRFTGRICTPHCGKRRTPHLSGWASRLFARSDRRVCDRSPQRRRRGRATISWSAPMGSGRRSGGWPSAMLDCAALNQWGWRFVMPCPPQITTWSVFMSRKSACLTMPIGGGRAYCYVDLMGTESPTSPASLH